MAEPTEAPALQEQGGGEDNEGESSTYSEDFSSDEDPPAKEAAKKPASKGDPESASKGRSPGGSGGRREKAETRGGGAREAEAAVEARLASRLEELEREWANQEFSRLQVSSALEKEMRELEMKLRRRLAEVEKRDNELQKLQVATVEAAERKMADIQLLHRRMREESDHQVSLYKNKASVLEKRLKRTQDELQASEARLHKVESDFDAYREQQRQTPEAKLRDEIARLQGVNAELSVRIEHEKLEREAEVRAKEVLRAQLMKAARELQKMRQLKNEESERALERLRVEFLAREERYVLDGDRKELQSIKADLDNLRRVSLAQEQ